VCPWRSHPSHLMMTQGSFKRLEMSAYCRAPVRSQTQNSWAPASVRSKGRHTHTVNVRTLFENCVGKVRKAVGAGPFTTLPDVSYCDP
jgi:hypothetical protein